MTSLRAWLLARGCLVAALGATIATVGDLGQLWVVNAGRPALRLPVPPDGLIVLATLAGTIGIPLYGIGYYVRAAGAQAVAPGRAAVLAVGGSVFAVLGGVVHGTTGVLVANDVAGIASGLDPLQGVLSSGPIVLTLWGLAAVALLVAALAEASVPQPHVERLFNPLLLTVAITGASGLMAPPWRDFIAPAAVNIAHLLFFGRLAVRT